MRISVVNLFQSQAIPIKRNYIRGIIFEPLFYRLIDNDKSLSIIATRAYDNGYYWTTFADITTLALTCCLISIFFFYFQVNGSLIGLLCFLVILVIGRFGSKSTTKKQISIGDEQIDVIRRFYKSDVEKYL